MVKINLLDVPQEQDPQKNKDLPAEQESPTPANKMDFEFFTDEAEQSSNMQMEPAESVYQPQQQYQDPQQFQDPQQYQSQQYQQYQDPASTEDPKTGNPFENQENFTDEYDAPPSIEDLSPKNNIFKYGLIALAVLLAIVAIFYFWDITGSDDPNSNNTVTNNTVTQPSNTPPPPAIPEQFQRLYSQNRQANAFRIDQLGQLLDAQAAGVNKSMVVVTPGHAYFSIIGDSRDAIAKYRINLQNAAPAFNEIKIESIQELFLDGQQKMQADFSIPLPATSSGRSANRYTSIQSAANAKSALRSTAQKYNLQYSVTDGEKETQRGIKNNYYYLRLTGKNAAIVDYLSEISNSLPSTNIAKISIHPTNGQMFSGNVKAEVELVISDRN